MLEPSIPFAGRAMRLLAALPLTLVASPACAEPKAPSFRFACQSGETFTVAYSPGRARVATATGSFDLGARPSSIGRKFSAGDVFFIHDQDRAVLVGTGDGCYLYCVETPRRKEIAAGGLPR